MNPHPPTWIFLIGIATKLVLALLAALSVWSIKIILEKRRLLREAALEAKPELRQWIEGRDRAALEAFTRSSGFQADAVKEMLAADQNAEAISYRVTAHLNEKRESYSRGLEILASLGSNAPFIGLFGTVLGIIQSFGSLATSQSAMNDVIVSLAEALTATAVGLFVAIPALTAFNTFSQRIRSAIAEAEIVRDRYLARFIFGK